MTNEGPKESDTPVSAFDQINEERSYEPIFERQYYSEIQNKNVWVASNQLKKQEWKTKKEWLQKYEQDILSKKGKILIDFSETKKNSLLFRKSKQPTFLLYINGNDPEGMKQLFGAFVQHSGREGEEVVGSDRRRKSTPTGTFFYEIWEFQGPLKREVRPPSLLR
jgi:hypothetical protein